MSVPLDFRKGAKTKKFELLIERIEKVHNDAIRQIFENNKSRYSELYGHVKVVKVFHGTKRENIPSILRNNLKCHRHGQNVGHRFGAGVSFSAISNYSSHYCDEDEEVKQMLLCLVLVSEIVEVPEVKNKRSTLQKPPFIENRWPPIRYDTTAKNKVTMDVIVKFEDNTFYPAFVISFQKRPLIPISVSLQPAHSTFQSESYARPVQNQCFAPSRNHSSVINSIHRRANLDNHVEQPRSTFVTSPPAARTNQEDFFVPVLLLLSFLALVKVFEIINDELKKKFRF
ncbi:Protein mono-ADP-ribosyltransferase PARP12 [Frankliniella fusca]|uniref:Poly [ADP-ribose] polymerase n=1 Tax=Frankliniella fusca TaxID=407009 RepID=A0AAE1H4J1_9NEOP|nr:Protein mono-ADP-ribosyltransferase PARP12 [Frankliniella fusca]